MNDDPYSSDCYHKTPYGPGPYCTCCGGFIRKAKLVDKFNYTNSTTPENYVCSKCGSTGVKLWRPYGSTHIELMCGFCASESEKIKFSTINENGCRYGDFGETDQIGGFIPAVPTLENDTYWGYTSLPTVGYNWWRSLPLYSTE